MTSKSRVIITSSALLISLSLVRVIFIAVKPGQDLYAYALSFIGLVFACIASVVLFPLRSSVGMRLFCTLAILITVFWAIELFGGLSWYYLDKLERHHQHS